MIPKKFEGKYEEKKTEKKSKKKNKLFLFAISNLFLFILTNWCGGLPSTYPLQAQDPFVVQGKQIIRLDQGKLYLAQKERQISFCPNVGRNGQTKSIGDF